MKFINGYDREAFLDKVSEYNNGAKCVDLSGACTYGGGGDLRCVVGSFIPDGHPGLLSEEDVEYLLEAYPDLEAYMPCELAIMINLQHVHDNHIAHGFEPFDLYELMTTKRPCPTVPSRIRTKLLHTALKNFSITWRNIYQEIAWGSEEGFYYIINGLFGNRINPKVFRKVSD